MEERDVCLKAIKQELAEVRQSKAINYELELEKEELQGRK